MWPLLARVTTASVLPLATDTWLVSKPLATASPALVARLLRPSMLELLAESITGALLLPLDQQLLFALLKALWAQPATEP